MSVRSLDSCQGRPRRTVSVASGRRSVRVLPARGDTCRCELVVQEPAVYRETASTTDREQASSRGRHGLCLCGRKVTGISRPDGLTSRACVAHAGVRRESPVRASCGRERGGRTACAERAWRALGKAATLVQVAAAARESALRVARLDQVAKGHAAFALARLCRNDALSSALGPLFSTTRR